MWSIWRHLVLKTYRPLLVRYVCYAKLCKYKIPLAKFFLFGGSIVTRTPAFVCYITLHQIKYSKYIAPLLWVTNKFCIWVQKCINKLWNSCVILSCCLCLPLFRVPHLTLGGKGLSSTSFTGFANPLQGLSQGIDKA